MEPELNTSLRPRAETMFGLVCRISTGPPRGASNEFRATT